MAKRIQNLQSSKLASIEQELRVLRAQINSASRSKEKGFNDLKGLWKGANFTFEEIQRAKLKHVKLCEVK